MNFETIIVEKKDGVAKITFNRPQVLNAFNPQMSDELKAAVKDIAADKEVRGSGLQRRRRPRVHGRRGYR